MVVLLVKNPSCSAGDLRDTGLITLWGRSPGGGHGNRLPYSCLENSMDRGAWWVKVIGSQRMGQGKLPSLSLWRAQVVHQERICLTKPETEKMWTGSWGREEPLEKEMATHSSIPVWKFP